MLRNPFLRNILLLSLLVALIFPLYYALVLAPAYDDVLVEDTQDEALRYARFLIHSLHLGELDLESSPVPEGLGAEVGTLMKDAHLIKIKLYAPSGRTLYSPNPAEIGELNDSRLFSTILPAGQSYSEVVHKEGRTADGQTLQTELVETYIPIIEEGSFRGAIEVYCNISQSRERLARLHSQSQRMLAGISAALLLLTLLGLKRAAFSMRRRQQAELKLQRMNEELEERVQQRTNEVEQALSESEKNRSKIDAILAAVPDALLALDDKRRVLLMNRAAEKLLGCARGSGLGLPLRKVVRDEMLATRLERVIETGEAKERFDWKGAGKGSASCLALRPSRLPGSKGAISGTIVLLQDVSRAREVERMKSEFLAMATHELNTPLTAILGYSEVLLNKKTYGFSPEQEEEFHQLVMDKAEHLHRIIGDLIDASRFEAGRMLSLDREMLSPAVLLEERMELWRRKYPQRPLRLETTGRPAPLSLDRERFLQAVEYLLSNAVKYSPGNEEIVLRQCYGNDEFELSVIDRGQGMDEAQLEHIFDVFYRVDASDSAVGGTGLGLSIVRIIAESHGGRIQAQSAKGAGTAIHLCLPLSTVTTREIPYQASFPAP